MLAENSRYPFGKESTASWIRAFASRDSGKFAITLLVALTLGLADESAVSRQPIRLFNS
jgi:hypothetical protein